ncbi:hypothetical protein ES705_43567 [subsurface metagenome]
MEIRLLIQQDRVEEIDYNEAAIRGKKWKPKMTINTTKGKVEKKAFNIKNWIKDKTEISDKKLT